MDDISQSGLVFLFLAAAAVVWWAGIHLARAVDQLDDAFGWGQAVGGMVLLAIATNLPEIAIVVSAVQGSRMDVAIGNILGGIAIQTVVLSVLDAFGNRRRTPLSTLASSAALQLEGLLVIVVLALVLVGHFLPASLMIWRASPTSLLIALVWVGALLLLRGMRSPGASSKTPATAKTGRPSVAKPAWMFAITATATLVAGVTLERSGDALAQAWGMQGAVFGATVLALATSLPEIATGIAATRLGRYELAVSDILGGNAFLPVLFLLATLLSGHAVLPAAAPTDLYMTALGILLSAVFVAGLLVKAPRKYAGMGIDSWLLVGVYAAGVLGLFFIAG
ncbi:sodium:calcium antiporter [Pseudoxanthomonas dokdonensis]|uniref:Sodium/calcium exchanger membrane region domain-containing protein n=1 Tax=Pseudoxanthomonas dokdonensis TaxID=344882 RepID=A0A0R0CN36_9GAMM|nr:hypothetical protein [Pseudoxanthomonas dokdonensis]KRG70987.1 hypothetical protein ABB29_03910 [Pseudoxanthomonas dokdonensis]